jgi:hypothetical protein
MGCNDIKSNLSEMGWKLDLRGSGNHPVAEVYEHIDEYSDSLTGGGIY